MLIRNYVYSVVRAEVVVVLSLKAEHSIMDVDEHNLMRALMPREHRCPVDPEPFVVRSLRPVYMIRLLLVPGEVNKVVILFNVLDSCERERISVRSRFEIVSKLPPNGVSYLLSLSSFGNISYVVPSGS